mmetsp:Transcript_51927/g.120673  ORF Transcript_51927/g.120673 Transcript_51927/m.120673 type:complete len:344 (-) Transcript_51927:735-1766(-)
MLLWRVQPCSQGLRCLDHRLLVRNKVVPHLACLPDIKVPTLVLLRPCTQTTRIVSTVHVVHHHVTVDNSVEQPGAKVLDDSRHSSVGDRLTPASRKALKLLLGRHLSVVCHEEAGKGGPIIFKVKDLPASSFRRDTEHQASHRLVLGRDLLHRVCVWGALAPSTGEVAIPEYGPVDFEPPVGVIAREAELHDPRVLVGQLCKGLLHGPAKEVPEALLVVEPDLLHGAVPILFQRLCDLRKCARVQAVCLNVENTQCCVFSEGVGQLGPLRLHQIGVGELQGDDVGVVRYRLHQFWRYSGLHVWRWHPLVAEVEVGERWVIQPRAMYHPDHPITKVVVLPGLFA